MDFICYKFKIEFDKIDSAKIDNSNPNLSLITKYAPSENKFFDKELNAVYNICKILYSNGGSVN